MAVWTVFVSRNWVGAVRARVCHLVVEASDPNRLHRYRTACGVIFKRGGREPLAWERENQTCKRCATSPAGRAARAGEGLKSAPMAPIE